MMILRIISFSLDRISAMDKTDSKDKPASDEYNWFNSILYVFYPTFVYPGLFISFTNFKECVNHSSFLFYVASKQSCILKFNKIQQSESSISKPLGPKVKEISRLLVRIIMSAILIEFVLHTTSTFTIHAYYAQMNAYFSSGSLVMSLVLKIALFASKYIVFYGTIAIFNEFLGMRVSNLPSCPIIIHTNKELWRYFDTGLYDFIKR